MPLIFAALLLPINDVTTTLEAPPAFMAIAALPAHRDHSLVYPESFKEKQRKLYPDLKPFTCPLPAQELFARALKLVHQRGWKVIHEGEKSLRIEAIATTALLRFKDDIVIEVKSEPSGSSLHMRSRSRLGRSDLAANFKRIDLFLSDLSKNSL